MVFNPNPVEHQDNLHSGVLLVATPALKDPNFEKSVILLSAHEKEEGAFGVVINRPLQRSLGDYVDEFRDTPLEHVEVFLGGPVQQNQLILAAWQWSDSYQDFRLFFGISREKAAELLSEGGSNVEVRGYLGYAGWTGGQLETEIKEKAWYKAPVDPISIVEMPATNELWKAMVGRYGGIVDSLLDFPDDPSLN